MIHLLFAAQVALATPELPAPTLTTKIDVVQLVQQMTLEEKVSLLGGTGFATKSLPRLGIPALEMTDGPLGIRFAEGVTQWPSGVAMGATFNKQLIREVGEALGSEARASEKRLILGPTVNNARTPWGGRSFESYGEDPFLSSRLTESYILGVQSQGVGTAVKHFAANNQEFRRTDLNVVIDERSLREIYLPAFQAAANVGATSFMSAYNKVNGVYAAESKSLLTDILKTEWRYSGFVMSDWGGNHSALPSALAGLDLEMPTGAYFSELTAAVQKGQISESAIDEKVSRILLAIEKIGLFEPNQKAPTEFKKHHPELARKAAQESLVLLKNEDSLLPLSRGRPLRIAMVGAMSDFISQGGGSSMVHHGTPVSPSVAFAQRLKSIGSAFELRVDSSMVLPGQVLPKAAIFQVPGTGEAGFQTEFFNSREPVGLPSFTRVDREIHFHWEWGGPQVAGIGSENFSVRWTSSLIPKTTGLYEFVLVHDDGVRLSINDKVILDQWAPDTFHPLKENRVAVELNAGEEYSFKLEYQQIEQLSYIQLGVYEPDQNRDSAVEVAESSDVAIVFVGNSFKMESESYDRASLSLTPQQEKLILDVAAVQPNTIVVVQAGSPVEMSEWLDKVKGVVFAWFPGEQGGYALADLLLGEINPSGRLPVSFPMKWEDSSAAESYPGENGVMNYTDGIFVGYRHFDRRQIQPLFPFGYGLSYVSFTSWIENVEIKSPKADEPSLTVTVKVKNNGTQDSLYMVPLYVSDLDPLVEKAPKELKGFEKVWVPAGETISVEFKLDKSAFQYFDIVTKGWIVTPSRYRLSILSNEAKIVDFRDIELE